MNEQEALKLYDALLSKGYSTDDLGDERTFLSQMGDLGNRKELYDWVSGRGDFRIGDYDSYERRLTEAKDSVNAEGGYIFTEGGLDSVLNKGYPVRAVSIAATKPPVQNDADGKKVFAPGQVRSTEKPRGESYRAPLRADLTLAERAEIERNNGFAAQGLHRLREDAKAEEDRRNAPLVQGGGLSTKTVGQWEDEVMQGASRISRAVVAPAVKKAIEDFDKKAHEVFEGTREGANNGGLPTGTASGATIFGSIKESNKAKDPEKVLDYLKGQMEALYKDQSFIDKVGEEADKMGIDRNEYLEKVVKPQIEADLGRQFDNAMIDKYLPKSGKEYVVSGLSNSIIGMLADAFLETKAQRAYKNEAAAMTEEGHNPHYTPGTGARLAQMGVSFAADAPFFGFYGKVGGNVAKSLVERQIRKLTAKGLSEGAAHNIVGTALENSVGQRMKNYIMQHVVSSSITMGGYNATSETARQVRDREFKPGQVIGSTAEGLATGAAFGLTGGAVQALSQPLSGIAKIGSKVGGYLTEGETMYATEELAKMVHGEEGFTNPFEGSAEAMMKLGVMKVSSPGGLSKAAGELFHPIKSNRRQQTGVRFTPEEEAYVRDSAEGKSLLDALSRMHPEVSTTEVKGKRRLTAEGEQIRQQLADRYNAFMGNTEIPYAVKAKVAGALGGLVPDAAHTPLETGADIIHNADGSVTLKTRDKDGNCMQELKFDTFGEADNWREEHEGDFRLNDAVNMWNNASPEARANTIRQLMDEYGVGEEEAVTMAKSALGGSMGKDFSNGQLLDIYDAVRNNAYPADEPNTRRNYWEGQKLTPQERHRAKVDAQKAEDRLTYMDQAFADEVIGAADYPDEKIAELAGRDEITGEQLQAAIDYYNKVSKCSGMMENALQGVDDRVEAANAFVRKNTHNGSGSVVEVESDGRGYYLTAGKLELNPDGSLNLQGCGDVMILRDKETGEIQVTNPQKIKVTALNDPQMMIADNESMEGLRGRLMHEAEDSIELAPGTPEAPQEAGELFTGADGKTYMVNAERDGAGNVVWSKVEVTVDENGEPVDMVGEPQPFDIEEYRKAKSNEIDAEGASGGIKESENIIKDQENGQNMPENADNAASEVTQHPDNEEGSKGQINGQKSGQNEIEKEKESASVRIPVDEKGRQQFERAKPEDTVAELTERYGEEKARRMIATMAENTARAYEELSQKDTSKMTDMAELAAHEDALAEAARKRDYWAQFARTEEPSEKVVSEEKPAEELPTVEKQEAELDNAGGEAGAESSTGANDPSATASITAADSAGKTADKVQPQQPTAEQKIAEGSVKANLGKTFEYHRDDGSRTEMRLEGISPEGRAVVTQTDYDAQGNRTGEPQRKVYNVTDIGGSIIKGAMKPVPSADEKLRRVHKYDRFKVGGVAVLDVLTDEEKLRVLGAFERGDKDAVGQMTGDFIDGHRNDLILAGRDMRNSNVGRIMEGGGSREEKLRRVRKEYQAFQGASQMLGDEAMQPATLEEYVADLHSRQPKSGEGPLAYFSYDRGGTKVVGMQDETGHGSKAGGDAKGYAPWLAPKGKGVSLAKYAEQIHGQLPEAVQAQYDDQQVRNAIIGLFTGAGRPGDVTTAVLRNRVEQAEKIARQEEDRWMEGGVSLQKVPIDADIESFKNWLKNGRDAVRQKIQGLDGYSKEEVLDIVRADIANKLEEAGIEGIEIKGMDVHGSRMRGDAREDSDLDVVVEYSGGISEDGLFNILNESPVTIEGVRVDINPVTKGKSGTLDQYMERSRAYDEEQAKLHSPSPAERDKALMDAVVDKMKEAGIDVSTDWEEGQRVIDEYNGSRELKPMGQKTNKKKAQVAADLEGKELAPEQQAVVDVYTGKKNNAVLSIDNKGKHRQVTIRKGNEQKAGTEHSLYRHYGTISNSFESEEILLIPEILKEGNRKQNGRRVSYELDKDGVTFTVTTEQKKSGNEFFTNFYTNKKADSGLNDKFDTSQVVTSNTDEPHVPQQSVSGAKVQKYSETGKESGENLKQFKTSDGHAYGFTYKGKIYIDPRIATAETPIHEYGHLWAEMKRQTAPEEWDAIKNVLLNDKLVKPIIDRVKKEYPELAKEGREDDFIEEILTQFSGKRGAERLREIADEIAEERGGVFGKAEAVTAMQRLKSVLAKFWAGVAKMMGWKYSNANEIADRMMLDMLEGVNPREKMKEAASDKVKEQKTEEQKRQKPFHDMIDELFTNPEFDKTAHSREHYDLGDTPEFMKKLGIKGERFTLQFKNIKTHLGKDADHNLTAKEWHELPEAIKKPFLITTYGNNADKFRLYTSVKVGDKFAVVGVDVVKINKGRGIPMLELNRIKTVFGRDRYVMENGERILAYDENITPEQEALLRGHNFREYPSIQELSSEGKDTEKNDTLQENQEKTSDDAPKFQRVGSPEPEMTPDDRQYWRQWDAAMRKWKERNAIAADAEGPGEKPALQRGESAMDYARKLIQWRRETAMWQTAPKLEDYHQARNDKDIQDEARANEQASPDNESVKRWRVATDLARLRHAMSRQKAYDKATVKAVTDFAQDFMKMGFGDNLTRGDVQRILSSVKNASGARDIKKHVDNVMRILTDSYLKDLKAQVNKLASVKELRQTAQGVDKQGKLELKGQKMIQEFRKATGAEFASGVDDLTRKTVEVDAKVESLRNRLSELSEKMDKSDSSLWEEEYEGVSLALHYFDTIARSQAAVTEYKSMREDAVKSYKGSGRDYRAQQELLESYDQAIEAEKIGRIGMYGELIGRLQGNISESMKGAHEFTERKKERVKRIHTLAARDMDGIDADTTHEQTWKSRLNNAAVPRLFLGSMGTFEQMLKLAGRKSLNGNGWLYNDFMRGYIDSVDREQVGREETFKALDDKVSEIFGKKMRLSSLYKFGRSTKKYPGATVEWLTADGEMKKHQLSQLQMLDIYMWNKQAEGVIKLREQGITEEKVEEIKNAIDPRLIQLADWFQSELSPKLRDKYNKVYERVFGASMPAVENYFPLRIIGDAITRDIDVTADPNSDNVLPSNTTGAIIRRKANTNPLDILGTDAVSLMIEHVENMEKWAAFVEWYEDINALLSYNRFKNQVKNMGNTIYGSGDKAWESFRKAAQIAAGTYRVSRSEADKAITTIASGVTGAKIAFRPYTALKQMLSELQFLPDISAKHFAKSFANPKAFWHDNVKWAMENLPVLRKRWQSRDVGDTRLQDTTGWGYWDRNMRKFRNAGIWMNGYVDRATCAAGARAIYLTRYDRYIKDGYDKDTAHKRAIQDAEIGYNLTQQSSEGAFVSAIQKDRTLFSNMWTVFRNSSMSYTRQSVTAVRNLKHLFTDKDRLIDSTTRQMMEDGIGKDQARKNAEAEYKRALWRNGVRLAVNAWIGPLLWEMGSKLPYIILGDDDEEKKKMAEDALAKELLVGPVEGFVGGQSYNALWGAASSRDVRETLEREGFKEAAKEGVKAMEKQDTNPLPLFADMGRLLNKFSKDEAAGFQDLVNIAAQMLTGANPQTLTDPIVAAIDWSRGDMDSAKEIELFLLRLLMVPQESARNIYIDELGMTAEEAKKLSFDEAAARYSKYMMQRGAPMFGWVYSDEAEKKRMDTYQKRFTEDVQERIGNLTDEEVERNRQRSESASEEEIYAKESASRKGYKDMDASFSQMKKDALAGDFESLKSLEAFYNSDGYRQYKDMKKDLEDVKDKKDEETTGESGKDFKYTAEHDADTPSGRYGKFANGKDEFEDWCVEQISKKCYKYANEFDLMQKAGATRRDMDDYRKRFGLYIDAYQALDRMRKANNNRKKGLGIADNETIMNGIRRCRGEFLRSYRFDDIFKAESGQ